MGGTETLLQLLPELSPGGSLDAQAAECTKDRFEVAWDSESSGCSGVEGLGFRV